MTVVQTSSMIDTASVEPTLFGSPARARHIQPRKPWKSPSSRMCGGEGRAPLQPMAAAGSERNRTRL
jgi:hypothetical protein